MTTPRSIHGHPADSLAPRLGSWEQVVRLEHLESIDGPSRGARRVRMVTGGGLDLELHPDRALDIGHVTVDGVPVSWISATGFAGPGSYDPRGSLWMQTFGGGLLATCGLRNFGGASVDGGEEFGQHGRVGRLPAAITRSEVADGMLVVEGEVREVSPMGESLVLRRRISAEVGGLSIRIEDRVRNEGGMACPVMILYHLNFGWPLLDDGTTIEVPASETIPRDEDAAAGLDRVGRFGPPEPGATERVFLHRFDGSAPRARVANLQRGLAVDIAASDTLPHLFQWTMDAAGTYVLGIEPANTPVIQGRAAAREAGVLESLEPGEERAYSVTLDFSRLG